MTAHDLERKGFVLVDGIWKKWLKPKKAKNEIGDSGLRAHDPKSTQGNTLERVAPREGQSGTGPVTRTRIRYDVYAVRPCDWDGYSIKELQDMLVHATLLSGDKWDTLEGTVVSHKAHSKEAERTEVTIEFQ